MGSQSQQPAEWSVDSEAMRARGIIVLVKSKQGQIGGQKISKQNNLSQRNAIQPPLFWFSKPALVATSGLQHIVQKQLNQSERSIDNRPLVGFYYNYIILVAILTTCLFRQNKFNIYFNYHSDSDECLNNSHNCSENATCTNTEGSFNCSCKPGYIGNGHNCSGWFLLSRLQLVFILLIQ